jgi:hypothetical protein
MSLARGGGPVLPAPRAEPPLWRPFALLAFGATLLGGVPLGAWMLARLAWGGGQVAPALVLLHAHLQVFGFFGSLIPGVALHLVPRFAGRPVAPVRWAPWLAATLAAALALRVAGAAGGWPLAPAGAALLQGSALGGFGLWLWRALAEPAVRLARVHLVAATAWLVQACWLEAAVRLAALAGSDPAPDPAGLRAVHTMALLGGVTGWILGVAVRAGPMLAPRWRVPAGLGPLLPALVALGVVVALAGELGGGPVRRQVALARLGDGLALAAVAALGVGAGAFRRAPRALPLLAAGGPEAGLFRLALASAVAASAGSVVAAGLAWWGVPLSLLGDALRHLYTVGFLTGVTLAMALRLAPLLEGRPLPWPALRSVALWALAGAVLLRTSEVLADWGWPPALALAPLAGALAWVAILAVAASVAGTVFRPRRGPL